jgi:diphosphomevalonate decarboxylase
MKFGIRSPSNIALIKYMGKTDPILNLPENPSLSMTLDSLSTYLNVDLDESAQSGDLKVRTGFDLEELPREVCEQLQVPELKGAGIEKMTKHWARASQAATPILKEAGFEPRLSGPACAAIQTANTFPMGSGIASSASSFSALTLAALIANLRPEKFEQFKAFWNSNSASAVRLKRHCAQVSRQGSGSSCRSFEGPWVEWSVDAANAVSTQMPEMAHFVVVLSRSEKLVSSSQAHLKVKTSSQWSGRASRVNQRFAQMKNAMQTGDVALVARLAWNEMWEMHNLFHTAAEPFSYWLPGTLNALHSFAEDMNSESPPIVTLDAGPNVHVLVPKSESARWQKTLEERFGSENLLCDRQGLGAQIL